MAVDKAHDALIKDLYYVIKKAEAYAYHDFKSDQATPKVNLVEILGLIIQNTKDGMYDNNDED